MDDFWAASPSANNGSASEMTVDRIKELFGRIKKARGSAPQAPTAYVMTDKTWVELLDLVDADRAVASPPMVMSGTFMGIPVETYATLEKCVDRLVSQAESEILQLVTSAGDDVLSIKKYRDWMLSLMKNSYLKMDTGPHVEFLDKDKPFFMKVDFNPFG